MTTAQRVIRRHPRDNVAVAVADLAVGAEVFKDGQTIGFAANMICFTAGRGTVCGFKPVATLKLATNTPM